MHNLVKAIQYGNVKKGRIMVSWLGQAGFVFKTDGGTTIGVDLYLSDCCNRYFGFKRLMPMLVLPEELDLDIAIATHAHYDHFDVDAMPILIRNVTRLVAALDCKKECERLNIKTDNAVFIAPGDSIKIKEVTIHAIKCDHGIETPYAIGTLLELSDKRIYITGDTSYRPDLLVNDLYKPDLLILPINGAFGNLNEIQVAKYADILDAQYTIPCHYWILRSMVGILTYLWSRWEALTGICVIVLCAWVSPFLI